MTPEGSADTSYGFLYFHVFAGDGSVAGERPLDFKVTLPSL